MPEKLVSDTSFLLELVLGLQPDAALGRRGARGEEPRRVVADRLAAAELHLAEYRRPDAVDLLVAGREVVPLPHLAESLRADLEVLRQRVFGLELIHELGHPRRVGAPAQHALEEKVRVPADRPRIALEERTDLELVAFNASLARNLDLGEKADVHRVPVVLGELEEVLPLEGVVVRADTRARFELEIRLGEPPLRHAISEAEARRRFADSLILESLRAHLEIDLALAVLDEGHVHVVVGLRGEAGDGQAEGDGCRQPEDRTHV